METKKIKTETTKMGYHALWEAGGGATNTGESTVICDQSGLPKRALYIKRGGHLANKSHALIGVEVEDIIVKCWHKRRNFWVRIFKITDFDGEFAVTEKVFEYSKGELNAAPPEYLQPAITAAMEKSTCYHCRSPHYIQ